MGFENLNTFSKFRVISSGAKQIHAFENFPLFAKFHFIMLEIIGIEIGVRLII